MSAFSPTAVSGAGDVPSRRKNDQKLSGDVIQTDQPEHPNTWSCSFTLYAIYHMLYSAAWFIGFVYLVYDMYTADQNTARWTPVIAIGYACVCRLLFYAQFLLVDGMGLCYVSSSRQLLKNCLYREPFIGTCSTFSGQ